VNRNKKKEEEKQYCIQCFIIHEYDGWIEEKTKQCPSLLSDKATFGDFTL
jgi:hypothetical protein